MERVKIAQYLKDFQERPLPPFFQRSLALPKTTKIITILGPRRSGKTFYFYQLMTALLKEGVKKGRIVYLNFEDAKLSSLRPDELEEVIKIHWELFPESMKEEIFIFIDEPQNMPSWEKGVRSIQDARLGRIFVTGSSAKMLSKEIATSLRGRTISYTLLPFSFQEFLKLRGLDSSTIVLSSKEEATVKRLLSEYVEQGGFPEIVQEQQEAVKIRIIKEYYDLVIYKDVIERHSIQNVFIIKILLQHLFSTFSKEFSTHSFFNTLKSQGVKVSKKTLYNYAQYIEDALAIFRLRKFSLSAKTRELSLPKLYLIDTGFANLSQGISEDAGKRRENVVFLELKRAQNANPLLELYYWKNESGKECDFVIKEKTKIRELVQVCLSTEETKTKDREIQGILLANDALKSEKLTIITEEYEAVETHDKKKIHFIPLWKWLLRKY